VDLKYTLVILLLTALLAQTFSRSIAMADYMVNLEAYKKACINKAKPKLQCNGKCQLLKKVKKQEGDSEANAPVLKLNQLEVVLSSKSFFPTLSIIATNNASSYYSYSDDFSSNYLAAIFHPPGA
jgi:hypothetical protein